MDEDLLKESIATKTLSVKHFHSCCIGSMTFYVYGQSVIHDREELLQEFLGIRQKVMLTSHQKDKSSA